MNQINGALSYREVFKASAYMPETLSDPETADSFSVTKTAFNRAFKTEFPLFEWFNQPENKLPLKAFSIGMTGTSKLVPQDNLPQSQSSSNNRKGHVN